MKFMKKVLSVLLAAVMALGLAVFALAEEEAVFDSSASDTITITKQPKARHIISVKRGPQSGESTSASIDLGMQVDVPAGSEGSLYYGIHFIDSNQKPIVQKYDGSFTVDLSYDDGTKRKTSPGISLPGFPQASKDIDFYVTVGLMEVNTYRQYAQSDPVKATLFLRFWDAIVASWEASIGVTALLLGFGIVFAPLCLIMFPCISLYNHIASLFN